jgi:hypothetical protein
MGYKDKDKKKACDHLYYEQHREAIIERTRKWHKMNSSKAQEWYKNRIECLPDGVLIRLLIKQTGCKKSEINPGQIEIKRAQVMARRGLNKLKQIRERSI